jgi:hypothetical protein
MSKYRAAILRNLESVKANNHCSEGYLELRKAPQQDAHSLPSLWYVSHQDIFTIPPIRPEIANFFVRNAELAITAKTSTQHAQDRGLTGDISSTIGKRSFHIQKSTCANCGYPAAKTRKCTQIPLPKMLVT